MAAETDENDPKRRLKKVEVAEADAEASEAEGEGEETAEAEGQEGELAEGEGAEAAEGEAETEKPARENRKERRRKRKAGEDDAPRDRNARVRERLTKKRPQAEALDPLTTSEMIDDALARGVHSAGKWARANANFLGYTAIALIVGGAAWGIYSWRSTSKAEVASRDLMTGVVADRAPVTDQPLPKPEKGEEEDLPLVFKTDQARADAALSGYRKAREDSPGSGTAILARLGEAGVLLDEHKWDDALAAYRDVKGSPLAAADPDVRGRAIEGTAFALEGKGDQDAALKAFKELDSVSGEKGWKELSMYHQARLLAAKGDKEQALKLIKEARERLQTSGEMRNFPYLAGVLDELHRSVDPTTAPKRNVGGADKSIGAEELQRLQQEMMRQLQKAQEQGKHE